MTQFSSQKHKGLSERLLKYIPFLLAVVLWCILVFKEQYYLKKVEDLSLFLFDKQFVLDSFRIPGGFLGLAGSFLTQFLHLPWIGSLLWVLLLLIAYQLTVRVFRIPDEYSPFALIPIVLLIIGNMSLGYGVFIMREQDHFFAPVLGYLASLVPLAITIRSKTVWKKLLLLAVWVVVGYALLGTFAFTGAVVVACATLVQPDNTRKERFAVSLSVIALIIFVPLIIYSAYTTYRLADSWTLGLPSISEETWTRTMRAPFQLALLCQIILALLSHKLSSNTLAMAGKIAIRSVVYLVAVIAVWGYWFKDENFHTELAMSEAVDRFDWNRAVEIYKKAVESNIKSDARAYASRTKKIASENSNASISEIVESYDSRFFEPTRTMVLYRDVALLKTDRALDEAFTMKDGGRKQKSLIQIPMALQSGKQFYLQYGLPNLCYRWCIEDAVEHGWSISTIKYMTLLSIVTGEKDMAMKYIGKLEKTLFYRKWAERNRSLAGDPQLAGSTVPFKSIINHMCFDERMSNDMGKTELYLMNHFLEQEPASATPEYDRTALLFAMRTQNIPRFWERLHYYINSNDVKALPRSVQEAALLYSTLEKDDRGLAYDEYVSKSYEAFNRYVQSHPIRDMKESEYPYCQKFGRTFYYFYYFMRNLQTY